MAAMTKVQTQESAQELARIHLREVLPVGTEALTILRHGARSGMARDISLKTIWLGSNVDITHWAAQALGERCRDSHGHNAIRVGGCGMDMGFSLVYNLSYVLYPKGFACIGAGCPSNDHSNWGDRENTYHQSGGYALKQRWL
jgi:hypothetical protein